MTVLHKVISWFHLAAEEHPLVSITGATLASTAVAWQLYQKFWTRQLPPEPDCPRDKVLLFQFCRGPYCPSLSPFPLKLETYLRVARIPYMTDLQSRPSSKGKLPWIRYRGQEVADSSFCISFLNKELGIDLNKGLSQQQRSVALAFQKLAEDDLCWCGVYFRWSTEQGKRLSIKAFGHAFYLRCFFGPRLIRQCHAQGMGRHSPDEIRSILMKDLQAISDYMGDNPYLMGDHVTEVDCSIFGVVAQIYWHGWEASGHNIITEHFPKLQAYCERMRQQFWMDWNDRVLFP